MAKKKKSNKVKSVAFTVILTIIVIAAFSYLVAKETQKSTDIVVATVNGEELTQTQLDSEFSKLPEQYQALISKDALRDQLIDKILLFQEAEKMGIFVTGDEILNQIEVVKGQFPTEEAFYSVLEEQGFTLEDIEKQIEEQLIINKLINTSVLQNIEITDIEITNYYNENKDNFEAGPGEIRAAHILVNTQEEANDLLLQLKKGADFEDLAVENSIDPSAQVNKGDLGFFSKTAMVEEFSNAAFDLKVNEISEPVQTQFGFHIIKRLSGKLNQLQAKESIKGILLQTKQAESIELYLKNLRDSAVIETAEPEMTDFEGTGDELCTEDEKAVVRMYTSENCPQCEDVKPAFYNAVADYELVVKEIDLSKAVESGLDPVELEVLKKYNPKGAVPSYIIGCQYVRIGNAYKTLNLEGEELAFREILDAI